MRTDYPDCDDEIGRGMVRSLADLPDEILKIYLWTQKNTVKSSLSMLFTLAEEHSKQILTIFVGRRDLKCSGLQKNSERIIMAPAQHGATMKYHWKPNWSQKHFAGSLTKYQIPRPRRSHTPENKPATSCFCASEDQANEPAVSSRMNTCFEVDIKSKVGLNKTVSHPGKFSFTPTDLAQQGRHNFYMKTRYMSQKRLAQHAHGRESWYLVRESHTLKLTARRSKNSRKRVDMFKYNTILSRVTPAYAQEVD